jgi:hypothetical protein
MQSTSEDLPVANQNIQNKRNWQSNQQNIQVQGFGGETSKIIMFPEQHLDNTLLDQQRPYMTGGEQQEQWQEFQPQQQQQQFLFPNQIQQLNPILQQQMEMETDVPGLSDQQQLQQLNIGNMQQQQPSMLQFQSTEGPSWMAQEELMLENFPYQQHQAQQQPMRVPTHTQQFKTMMAAMMQHQLQKAVPRPRQFHELQSGFLNQVQQKNPIKQLVEQQLVEQQGMEHPFQSFTSFAENDTGQHQQPQELQQQGQPIHRIVPGQEQPQQLEQQQHEFNPGSFKQQDIAHSHLGFQDSQTVHTLNQHEFIQQHQEGSFSGF